MIRKTKIGSILVFSSMMFCLNEHQCDPPNAIVSAAYYAKETTFVSPIDTNIKSFNCTFVYQNHQNCNYGYMPQYLPVKHVDTIPHFKFRIYLLVYDTIHIDYEKIKASSLKTLKTNDSTYIFYFGWSDSLPDSYFSKKLTPPSPPPQYFYFHVQEIGLCLPSGYYSHVYPIEFYEEY